MQVYGHGRPFAGIFRIAKNVGQGVRAGQSSVVSKKDYRGCQKRSVQSFHALMYVLTLLRLSWLVS